MAFFQLSSTEVYFFTFPSGGNYVFSSRILHTYTISSCSEKYFSICLEVEEGKPL